MKLEREGAEVFVPDGTAEPEALARTTHMAVGAHQDDLEIIGIDGILSCFQQPERWFCGVVVTDGAGAPRDGLYRDCSDEEMRRIRRSEQRKAAVVGEYGSQVMLDYSSTAVKDSSVAGPIDDLQNLMEATRPAVVYTHNPADKHDTHVAVTLRLLAAVRRLPASARPPRVLGCEVWRDLDWLVETDKAVLDVTARESLQAALLGVFDSQICGGKRYDQAALARRRAHATFHQSHATDAATGLVFAMDLSPLVEDPDLDLTAFVTERIAAFAADVTARITRLA